MNIQNITDAHTFARKTLDEHGLTDWSIRWSNAKKQLGLCEHRNKRIAFSQPLFEVNDADMFIDTVRHEVAHALVGPLAGHGPVWRAKARQLGCRPRASTREGNPVPARYTGTCSNGHDKFTRHRRPKYGRARYCGVCGIGPQGLITWTDTTTGERFN